MTFLKNKTEQKERHNKNHSEMFTKYFLVVLDVLFFTEFWYSSYNFPVFSNPNLTYLIVVGNGHWITFRPRKIEAER